MKAILYAAKSTPDERGSIRGQINDCEAMAEREGWKVIDKFSDVNASAWKGDRGPELAAAMELAEENAPSILVVQHSDRLARGDALQARHLVEVVLWGIKAGVTIRSVQDDLFADERVALLMGAMMGQRNTEDSARKSKATSDGLQRRKEAGKPVGRIPLGYTVDKDEEGKPVGPRKVDPVGKATVERVFELVESGLSFGDVARTLNTEGSRGSGGKPWAGKSVSQVVHNVAYVGEKGYDLIIPSHRFNAIQAKLRREDPAGVAKRRGGRKPHDDTYFLRGIAFCGVCGATLYSRTRASGLRQYLCSSVRRSLGTCDASAIPAELAESHVLRHLDSFIGSVEGWLVEQVEERDSGRRERERGLVRQRAKLNDLERLRERAVAMYRKLLDEGESTASLALKEAEKIDGEVAEQEQAIQEAEAVVSEWSGPPDVDAALDFYGQLVDQVKGRIRQAEGASELNRTLSQVVAGLWARIEGDKLLVEFELVADLPDGVSGQLPPRKLDERHGLLIWSQIAEDVEKAVKPGSKPRS